MILRKCDLCGRISDPKDRWDCQVQFFEYVIIAPDGVNHSINKHDLCRGCRTRINDATHRAISECRKEAAE